MRHTLLYTLITLALCLPAQSQNLPNGTEILQSKVQNWQTLNDEHVCAVTAFFVNDFAVTVARMKRDNTYWLQLQDRDPHRSIVGKRVALSANGKHLGSGVFSATEAFAVPLTSNGQSAVQNTLVLRATGDRDAIDFRMNGSAAASDWLKICDRKPPVTVDQRPLNTVTPNFSTSIQRSLK